jgi:hypothetical protein
MHAFMKLLPNKSANTDPHLHKAASPLMVVVRLPLRYAASPMLAPSQATA